MRPLLLDLFCGAGGAAVGYYRAGFDVIGVDIAPQPNYPFRFIQADALESLQYGLSLVEKCWGDLDSYRHGAPYGRWTGFHAAHASPPCQRYTTLAKGNNANEDDYPDLIPATRELLKSTGLPYVIENVPAAPLNSPITLCGEMFGLDVIRHRCFESNIPLEGLPHSKHRGRVAGMRHGKWYDGPYFAVYGDGGGKGTVAQWQQAMGIDWTDVRKEIAESIPPAYSEYVGTRLLRALEVAA
jgi:DNA (cytosine-5)-methyltransferase 1